MIKTGSKVRCIDNNGVGSPLTLNHIYIVKRVDDFGALWIGTSIDGWLPSRFLEVSCPCNIKNCLTHRVK